MKSSCDITVLSTYQPPKGQVTEGTINVTAQQTQKLADKDIKLNIFQQYRQDIGNLIIGFQRQNHEIILGGDFNERNDTNNVIEDIFMKHCLVDIMLLKHPKEQSTYLRGTHALDRIFLTPSLITSNTIVNLEDQHSIIDTDHVLIRIQIEKNAANTTEYHLHHLVSNHSHKVTKYIQEVHTQMLKYNLFRTIRDIKPDTVSAENLNNIDRLWVNIRLKAEAK
jgi:hypothetical protein